MRPGQAFRVRVGASSHTVQGARIYAEWVDAKGTLLGPKLEIPQGTTRVLSSPSVDPGYLGLVFSSDSKELRFVPQERGFRSTEYGFAVLPPATRRPADPRAPFGVVHGDVTSEGSWDPQLSGLHVKTMTWNSVASDQWAAALAERANAGVTELPLIVDDDWKTDDDRPVTTRELDALQARFEALLQPAIDIRDWEAGIEENFGGTFFARKHYFTNLTAKLARLRGVADRLRPSTRFVYNVVGFDRRELELLFANAAMREIDVFSTHPYRWNEFEAPESWLADHLGGVRDALDAHGHTTTPIWITEIGAPVRGNQNPDGFFGYPDDDAAVPGVSRDYAARYLVKYHAIALAAGVERIYVYNYQNRGNDVEFAEDHFGLRAYAERGPGHPLPAYVAFARLVDELRDTRFARRIPNLPSRRARVRVRTRW